MNLHIAVFFQNGNILAVEILKLSKKNVLYKLLAKRI